MANKIKQTNSPSFSIIIPNYNGSQFLDDCLYSLYQAIKQCSGNFEIIIIDNASKDDSLDVIKNFFNQYKSTKMSAKITQLNTNLGFAGAVNMGINQAKYEYVVLCNNDLTLEPNWFQLISDTIKNNKNPKITTFFGTVLSKGGTTFESQGLKFFIKGKAKNVSNGKTFKKSLLPKLNKIVWGASAALVVYQKDIIQKIGLFDDDFFAYEEDVDVALRLANLNYKTLYIPQAICYHLGGGTSNKMGNFRNRMDAKNWIYLIKKNYSTKDYWSNFPSIFIERLRNLSGLTKATIKTYKLKSIYKLPFDLIKTYGEVLIKLPKMTTKRKQTQKLLKSIKL
ncbi:MAG: glycosyltransferase family 2 protein [Candidatus Shapirobacteria bacterium]